MEQLAKSKARPGVACFSGVRPPRDTLSALKKLFENNLTLRLILRLDIVIKPMYLQELSVVDHHHVLMTR